MHILYALLMAIAASIGGFILLRSILKPVTGGKKKFVDESKKAGRSLNEFNLLEVRDKLLVMIKTVNISDEFREEMNADLYRLGIPQTAEDIRKMQLLYSGLWLFVSIILVLVSVFVGVIALACLPFIFNYPVNAIKSQINRRNDEFLMRLHELYTVIFNQYKRNNGEHLGKIISAFIPTTTDLMRKELMLVMRDIESGEDYALKQLKRRIPNPIILRFCDIILTNLDGAKNVDVMQNFYLELKQERDIRRRKRNEARALKIDAVNKMLYIPFGFLVIVYLLISTMSQF